MKNYEIVIARSIVYALSTLYFPNEIGLNKILANGVKIVAIQ